MRPIFVVAPPCAGARRVAGLLAAANRDAQRPVEGSARHALELEQLSSRFPESLFIYVHRDPVDALSEALAGWKAGTARRTPQPLGWTGPPWSFVLVPGWESLRGRPLAEIVVEQWLRIMRQLLGALDSLPLERWCVTSFAQMLATPPAELRRLGGFLGVDLSGRDPGAPLVSPASAARPPRPAPVELLPYLHRTRELAERAAAWIA